MLKVQTFTFSPFQENTYLLYDATNECVIIDPGCYDSAERMELNEFIDSHGLKPVAIWNTHAHLDHIFGNRYLADKYSIPVMIHEGEVGILGQAPMHAKLYGLNLEPSPEPARLFKEGESITFGETTFKVFYTPGHTPGHVSLYNADNKILFSGDVLFMGSIGRTDLPGGDHETLMGSISSVLMELDDDVEVYSGHGPVTTIGRERTTNPYILQYNA